MDVVCERHSERSGVHRELGYNLGDGKSIGISISVSSKASFLVFSEERSHLTFAFYLFLQNCSEFLSSNLQMS